MKVCRKFFNLVEITLAMAVVGIGVAGIMAMFPPAVEASRNAIAENYAADTSNTMMAYIERAVKADWSSLTNSSSDSYVPDDTYKISLTPNLNPGALDEGIKATADKGVYTVKNGLDFVAHAKIWKEPIPNFYYIDGASVYSEPVPTGYGIRICMELSWPVMKPYSEREKKVYVMELRNPNP